MALETVDYGVVRIGPVEPSAPGATVYGLPQAPQDSVPQDFYWVVTAMTSQVRAPAGVVLTANVPLIVWDSDPTIAAGAIPISKTIDGVLDVNDTCRLIIPGGNTVVFQWLDVPANCKCYARFQYELVQPVGAAAQRPVMH